MQFVMIARHTPELCPTSNAKIRQIMKESPEKIPAAASKAGVKIVSVNVCGPEHEVVAILEANAVEQVREFAVQSRLMQWNTIAIHATWSMQEAMARIDELPTIF